MLLSKMIEKLTAIQAEHGEVVVMFTDMERESGPWEVNGARLDVAEEGEFPEDFDMPAGFKFVHIRN